MDDIALLKVDLKNKTIFDTRSSRPLDIAIQDGMITLVVQSESEEMKIDDAAKIELRPPYSLKQRGTIVFKSKNRTNTHNAEGQCKEIEASVFKRALKESDLRWINLSWFVLLTASTCSLKQLADLSAKR